MIQPGRQTARRLHTKIASGSFGIIDLEKKMPVRIDRDTYVTPERGLNPDWSPDSRWIAYTKILKNHLRAVFLYSLEDGQSHQASDGMSDAQFAKFDKNGKYLYFTASTNVGLTTGWLDMSATIVPLAQCLRDGAQERRRVAVGARE